MSFNRVFYSVLLLSNTPLFAVEEHAYDHPSHTLRGYTYEDYLEYVKTHASEQREYLAPANTEGSEEMVPKLHTFHDGAKALCTVMRALKKEAYTKSIPHTHTVAPKTDTSAMPSIDKTPQHAYNPGSTEE